MPQLVLPRSRFNELLLVAPFGVTLDLAKRNPWEAAVLAENEQNPALVTRRQA
jgi:hypothetical protein